jgi:hypothetical protein
MPIATIMTFIAGALLTFYLGALELAKKDKNWWRFAFFTLLFLIFLGAGLYDILKADDEKQETKKEYSQYQKEILDTTQLSAKRIAEIIDSTKKSILDSIRMVNKEIKEQGEENTRDILNSRTIRELEPHLNPCGTVWGKSNPYLKEVSNDTLRYVISICNDGETIASNLNDKLVLINYKTDVPSFDKNDFSVANKSVEIAPNQPGLIFPMTLLKSADPNDPTVSYIYFKVSYTKKNGKTVYYLRKIFGIRKDLKLQETSPFQYNTIAKELQKNHLW